MVTVIRNPRSGLVLDASKPDLKIEHFTGFSSQLWTFEQAGGGKFFIVNQGNGKVVDIQGGIISGSNVITDAKNGSESQHWFINSDSTIVSAVGNLALDIFKENYNPGTNIIAYPKHGKANQQFTFQYE